MDAERYADRVRVQEKEWETRCTRCGACCGRFDDPCDQLVIGPDGLASCRSYAARFETSQRTLGGKVFHCVPIRLRLRFSWPGDEHCGYKQLKGIKPSPTK